MLNHNVSCILCKKTTTTKGLSGHFFSKHDPIGITKMINIRKKGTDASFRNPEFQKNIHNPKKVKSFRTCHNPECKNITLTKYCSQSCAAIISNATRSNSSRKQQAETLLRNKRAAGWNPKIKYRNGRQSKTRTCVSCGRVDTTTGRFQSDKCIYCNDSLTYRNTCKFTFNLKDYPNEFDLPLLITPGMFHPRTNSKGVSRDHLLSIDYGKKNKVDPKILSHPANCRLILQSENSTKCYNSLITLDELLVKISEWDKKYSK